MEAGRGREGGLTYVADREIARRSRRPKSTFTISTPRSSLLGLDHERLTFRHGGRDYRLTDWMGSVEALLTEGRRGF